MPILAVARLVTLRLPFAILHEVLEILPSKKT
jgi:hypothetical protein